MLIFNLKNKGPIFQKFMANHNPLYKEAGLAGHTGVDHGKGYGMPVLADNDGFVYKVLYGKDRPSNWQAVYMLCNDGKGKLMEICYGHLSAIHVKVGDLIKAGQIIGLEGNLGDVFSGGQRITAQMQRLGDKRGSHVHESWRPVKAEKGNQIRGVFYLEDAKGSVYKNNGLSYEILNRDALTRGFIDPMTYSKTAVDVTSLQLKLIDLLQQLYKLLNSK